MKFCVRSAGWKAKLQGGRVEMQNALAEMRKLSERVRALELWHAWLRGAWAVVAAAYVYLYRQALRLANVV